MGLALNLIISLLVIFYSCLLRRRLQVLQVGTSHIAKNVRANFTSSPGPRGRDCGVLIGRSPS